MKPRPQQNRETELSATLRSLGIEAATLRARGLRRCAEARQLTPVGLGTDGRDKLLVPRAAAAWQAMRAAAADDGIELLLISAFRSIDYQAALLRMKLARGDALDAVLRVNAPPGYSEHHSGRAIDIGCAGVAALDERFEDSAAYAWLGTHAARFGFVLSYPRDNAQGYLYEPWHWCWHAPSAATKTR